MLWCLLAGFLHISDNSSGLWGLPEAQPPSARRAAYLLVRREQLVGGRDVDSKLIHDQGPPDAAVHAVSARGVALILHRCYAHVVQARHVQQSHVERLQAKGEDHWVLPGLW